MHFEAIEEKSGTMIGNFTLIFPSYGMTRQLVKVNLNTIKFISFVNFEFLTHKPLQQAIPYQLIYFLLEYLEY